MSVCVRWLPSGKKKGKGKEGGRSWTYLLAETDARTGVEGEEDKRIGYEVLVQTFVEEAVWVKFLCCA